MLPNSPNPNRFAYIPNRIVRIPNRIVRIPNRIVRIRLIISAPVLYPYVSSDASIMLAEPKCPGFSAAGFAGRVTIVCT